MLTYSFQACVAAEEAARMLAGRYDVEVDGLELYVRGEADRRELDELLEPLGGRYEGVVRPRA